MEVPDDMSELDISADEMTVPSVNHIPENYLGLSKSLLKRMVEEALWKLCGMCLTLFILVLWIPFFFHTHSH